jgi:hypothetical protein
VLFCIVLYCVELQCIFYCLALRPIRLYCIELQCIVLLILIKSTVYCQVIGMHLSTVLCLPDILCRCGRHLPGLTHPSRLQYLSGLLGVYCQLNLSDQTYILNLQSNLRTTYWQHRFPRTVLVASNKQGVEWGGQGRGSCWKNL